MTPETIALIRSQLALTKGAEDAFAAAFYRKLFEIAPEVRVLFPADLSEQGRKLMVVLTFAVGALDRGDVLVPAVQALGARHKAYGVKNAHFAPVGGALLDTLAGALGDGFTPEALAAWTQAYGLVAGWMAEGLDQPLPDAA